MSGSSQLKNKLLLAILRAPTRNAASCLHRVALPAPLQTLSPFRAFSISPSKSLDVDTSNDTTSIKITRSFTDPDRRGSRHSRSPDRRPWQRSEPSSRNKSTRSTFTRDSTKHDRPHRQNTQSNTPTNSHHRSLPTNPQHRSPPSKRLPTSPPKKEPWQIQKAALAHKFEDAPWSPRKRLSPDTLDAIRTLHTSDPMKYTTPILSDHFAISAEAIRRILRSKWRVSPEEMDERRRRWARRHDRIWDAKAELGLRPPRRTEREVEDPEAVGVELERRRMLGADI